MIIHFNQEQTRPKNKSFPVCVCVCVFMEICVRILEIFYLNSFFFVYEWVLVQNKKYLIIFIDYTH